MTSISEAPKQVFHFLLYQVKTQYVQILKPVDTSVKHAISGQSSSMPKGCMPGVSQKKYNVADY